MHPVAIIVYSVSISLLFTSYPLLNKFTLLKYNEKYYIFSKYTRKTIHDTNYCHDTDAIQAIVDQSGSGG